MDLTVRQATHDDFEAVAGFTRDTWADRDGSDYIPRIYHDWIEAGDPEAERRQRTLLAETPDGEVVGVAQVVALSPWEAWCQGMRVHPESRGAGVSTTLNDALFDWARERGATVARNMVFSWNVAGLGASRAAGFGPATEFRWSHPDPDPDADPRAAGDGDLRVTGDPDAAWTHWTDSDARDHLRGLALDGEESWAVSTLTRADLHAMAEETAVFAVRGDDGVRGASFRVRDYERENDEGETERFAEYGVGSWTDAAAARTLHAAISRDAAEVGADHVRVLIPETVRHVSDVCYARVEVSDEPDFVLAADLTADRDRPTPR